MAKAFGELGGIGAAVKELQGGEGVRRIAWSGGRWLELARTELERSLVRHAVEGAEALKREALPTILVMTTGNAEVSAWKPTHDDLLATDWEVVPAAERLA